MNDLYKSWSDALLNVGIKPICDDTCCKLLAVVYVFGGGRSEVTLNPRLHTDILYAQKRLNLSGGEIPDPQLTPLLQQYIQELTPQGLNGEWIKTDWAIELMNRYDLIL